MPISVTCPECEATYRVADEAAGKAIKCKKCGARVPVPAGDGEEEDRPVKAGAASDEDESAAGGSASVAKKKGGSNKKLIIIIASVVAAGCCVCTVGGGGLAYYVFNQSVDAAKDFKAKFDQEMQKAAKGGPPAGGGGPVGGTTILEKKETLAEKDPPKANNKPAKEYKLRLEQGKTYVIDMKADKKLDPNDFKNPRHDPYLRLLDPSGKEVAKNDDFEPGLSLDSRIVYSAGQTGEYTIQATVLGAVPPGGMPFTLTVKQQ